MFYSKLKSLLLLCGLLLMHAVSNAQPFGNGSDGPLTVTAPNTTLNQYAEVLSLNTQPYDIGVSNTSFFAVGKRAILMQMTGAAAGTWEWVTVSAVNAGVVTVNIIVQNYTLGNGAIQLIAVPNYTNLTINTGASVVPALWNGTTGGVVAVQVSGVLTIQAGGSLNASGYGFQPGAEGIGGTGGAGGFGGATPGANGGSVGLVINSGIGGGGDGGAKGAAGTTGSNATTVVCPGCTIASANVGIIANNNLMMGGAGQSGNAGGGHAGAGGGGAGASGSLAGAAGTAGGNGGNGGNGGVGGAGGGIIIAAVNDLALPNQACILANGLNATGGVSGVAGGAGGWGGLGGGGCVVGGGGGGGNGGDGGDGGGGGNGGAGGMIKIIRSAVATAPTSTHKQFNGGTGGNGGNGGAGGAAGVNAGSANGMLCSGGGGGTGSGGSSGAGVFCDAAASLNALQNMGAGALNNGTYTNLGNGFHFYTNGIDSVYIEEINALTVVVRTIHNDTTYFTVISGTGAAPSPLASIQQIFNVGNISYPPTASGQFTANGNLYTADCTPVRNQPQPGLPGALGLAGVAGGNGADADEVADCSSNPLSVSFYTTQEIDCINMTQGFIQITASGGTGPYLYTYVDPVSGPVTNTTGNFEATNNPQDAYVTDANGCISTPIQAQADLMVLDTWDVSTSTNVTCYGANNGLVQFNTYFNSGVPAILNYVVDQNNNFYYPTMGGFGFELNNLAPGSYTLVQSTCFAFANTNVQFNITEPDSISVQANITSPSCTTTGAIDLIISGGTAPYNVVWSDSQTGTTAVGLNGGIISAVITDATGCSISKQYTLTSAGSAMNITITNSAAACGLANGSATAIISGGTMPYSLLWSNMATVPNIQNLTAGVYSIAVQDANGCTASASTTVNAIGAAFTVSTTATPATCGAANGAALASVNGGTAPYSYLWSNGATSAATTNLAANTYTIMVSDAFGCAALATAIIPSSGSNLNAVITATNASCGATNGTVTINISNGTAPYTYLWNTGATTSTINNLNAGTYIVNASDANGCSRTDSVQVLSIGTVPVLTATVLDAKCHGGNNGIAQVIASGATAPYTYLWSNGSTTASNDDGTPGTYTVLVTSADGCVAMDTLTINQPTAIQVSSIVSQPACNSTNGGAIDLTVSGGTPGYLINWSNGSSFMDQFNLAADTYVVSINDSLDCLVMDTFIIQTSNAPQLNGVVTNPICANASTGSIFTTLSGGTAPFAYLWSNGATTANLNAIGAGSYTVIVTDTNACADTASFLITPSSSPLVITYDKGQNVACYGGNNGQIATSVNGGTPSYTYTWSNGGVGQSQTNLPAGTYTLTVTDANGCTAQQPFTILQPPSALTASASGDTVLCPGQNGHITITANGGSPAYTGTGVFTVTTGMNTFVVADKNGCLVTVNWFVQTAPAPQVSLSSSNDCGMNGSGSITAVVTGGTPSYLYVWSTGAGTPTISNLSAGYYWLDVKDANGCKTSTSVNIKASPLMTLTGIVTDAYCSPANSGTVDISISGGVPSYTYLWSNGTTNEDLTAVVAGNYSVTVTDDFGCSSSDSFVVNDGCACPANFHADICGPTEICAGESFVLTSQVMPRAQGYPVTYSWTRLPAGFTAATANITQTGLLPGTYTYTLTVVYSAACSTTTTHTVVIHARPAISVTNALTGTTALATQLPGCNVVLNASGGTYYNWSLSAVPFATHGNILSDANTTIAVANQTRTYAIVGIDQYGCSNSASIQVRLSTLSITKSYSSLPAGPNSTVNGNVVPIYTNATYAWSGPNGYTSGPSTMVRNFSRIDLLANMTGTYTATVTQNGCSKTISFLLTPAGQVLKPQAGVDILYAEESNNNLTDQLTISATKVNADEERVVEGLQFTVFPNPTARVLQLSGATPIKAYTTARVYDMNGKLLLDVTLGEKQQFEDVIDVNELPAGSYLLVVDCGTNGVWKQKFMKQ